MKSFVFNISFLFLTAAAFYSCKDKLPAPEKRLQDNTEGEFVSSGYKLQVGDRMITLSADTSQIKRILFFKMFTPVSVKYLFSHTDTSGGHAKDSLHFDLEAVLYFDSITFQHILNLYHGADYNNPYYDKAKFNFIWSDQSIIDELKENKTSVAFPDLSWTVPNDTACHILILQDKVLLRYSK